VLQSLEEIAPAFRAAFTHPMFNAVQSACFVPAYYSDVNMVVSGAWRSVLVLAGSHHRRRMQPRPALARPVRTAGGGV
jgi:hypothetical protein